jgi:hypothetical protein
MRVPVYDVPVYVRTQRMRVPVYDVRTQRMRVPVYGVIN